MSFGAWLKSLFGRARKRDISRLAVPEPPAGSAPGSALPDDTAEWIDLSGAPLKEHHRRRAWRDKRLLPKIKSPARQLSLTKRKSILSVDEAQRLFGGTLRTRNRRLRDLLADEDQLRRHALPIWKTEADVAQALGIFLKELWFFAIHRERERQPHYVTFSIPKRSGGRRLILAPKRRLKAIQRKLQECLVSKLPLSDGAHAFRRGHSIRTGAEPHVAQRGILKLDLKDFFPTVTAARIRGFLIACGYSFPVATTLAVLMTESKRQPVDVDGELFHVPIGERHCVQGAPTSPSLCNALLLRLDRRLAGVARKRNLRFTRYADDLTFSGDLDRPRATKLAALISRVVSEEGFKVNPSKTRLMLRGSRQTVTGVVVNQTLGLSRQERRRLRAMAHQLAFGQNATPARQALLKGKVAYLAMLNPAQAAPFQPPPAP